MERKRKTLTPFLVGKALYLRPLSVDDADGPYPGWLNDANVCRGNSHHVYPYAREAAIEYIERAANSHEDLILAIVLKTGDRHIGNIALQRIHWVSRSAEFAILLGDTGQWGKGYGLEAARLLIHHGFSSLNLLRIACATFEANVAMRKLAAALGMKEEGIRRQAAYKDGRYLDVIEFGLLRDECEGLPRSGREKS
jgi:RimJ/RimL family protein N-acetyltransferase